MSDRELLPGTDRDIISNFSTSEIPEFQIIIKSESVESSTSTSTTDTVAHPNQSSSSTTNPEVQSTSSLTDKEDNKNSRLLNAIVYTGECLVPKIEKQSHLKRLQNLRKEINYLKDTEWMYDPIE